MIGINTHRNLKIALLASAGMLGLGISAPAFTMDIPIWGDKTYSILSGLYHMVVGGMPVMGIVVFLFSVVFPTWKLCVLWHAITDMNAGESPGRVVSIASALGKFSMLDVFIIALIVLTIKGLPVGEVHMNWGTLMFGSSIVLSIILSVYLKKIIHGTDTEQAAGSNHAV